MTRVLLVEDRNLMRDALCRVMRDAGDIGIIATTNACAGSVWTVRWREIDVVVVDMAPAAAASDTLSALRKLQPHVHVLCLSDTDDRASVLAALSAGADGFVTQHDDGATLLSAIHCVAAGRRYVGPGAGWHLAQDMLVAPARRVRH